MTITVESTALRLLCHGSVTNGTITIIPAWDDGKGATGGYSQPHERTPARRMAIIHQVRYATTNAEREQALDAAYWFCPFDYSDLHYWCKLYLLEEQAMTLDELLAELRQEHGVEWPVAALHHLLYLVQVGYMPHTTHEERRLLLLGWAERMVVAGVAATQQPGPEEQHPQGWRVQDADGNIIKAGQA